MKTIKLNNENITPSKVVCIGRNYVEHIKELNNEIPENMVLFNKPNEGYLEYFKINCKDQNQIDELNLYYVAVTRAKTKLIDKTDFNYLTPEIAELEIENEIKEFLKEKK